MRQAAPGPSASSGPMPRASASSGPMSRAPASRTQNGHCIAVTRVASHLLHVLAEVALGVMALAAIAVCVLAWRLGQGPIDVTWLVQRMQPRLSSAGARLAVEGADLAWEGFDAADQPLDLRLRGVTLAWPNQGVHAAVQHARITIAEAPLLLGRVLPGSIDISGATVQLNRLKGALPPNPTGAAKMSGTELPTQLQRLHIADAVFIVHDPSLTADLHAAVARLELVRRPGGGLAGSALADVSSGGAHVRLTAEAAALPAGTRVTAHSSALDLASLARTSPSLAALTGIDLPVGLILSADLDAHLQPLTGRLEVAAGAGHVRAGRGQVTIAHAAATILASPDELRLTILRIQLAQLADAANPAPIIAADATLTRAGGHLHAGFGVGLDSVQMADLGKYWPVGTGGGARDWLVKNITAGRAHDAHVSGALDMPVDLSDAALTALAGGLLLDDATVWWLRPVPPLVRGRARVTIEGPDSLKVTLSAGSASALAVTPGSAIRITGLMSQHQFGEIDMGLAGPLADALGVLDHPRLGLLARGGVTVVDPAGTVQARVTVHVPLETYVTMDDIPVAATATLSGVHLGRGVAGHDLDRANLAVHVTNNGLGITGDGTVAGIPARLALDMDFRNGPPSQVVQRLTAAGAATLSQLKGAGLPTEAATMLTGGTVGLRIDYSGRRDATAALQVNADLSQAAITTPFGWTKQAGPPAAAEGKLRLARGGVLAGIDTLHAEGPELAFASRMVAAAGRANTLLLLDRLDVGGTRARGEIRFPAKAGDPVAVSLTGPTLDLSALLDKPEAKPASQTAGVSQGDQPGLPYTVKLDFAQVRLAHGKTLSPLSVVAASNGLYILHAAISGGPPGALSISIVPGQGSRHVVVAASDAGLTLRALGVADNLQGGSLKVDGTYNDATPASPLTGTATLENFNLREAPAIGRLLQVMTLYGVADTLHGPGLHFSRLIAPFHWERHVLHLSSARAFSPSLGITANGDLDLRQRTADVRGTIVPAYFFNQMLGNLPLIGRVFSPEKGSGLFAARYSVRGKFSEPKVGVNPLSALTPGFLREAFRIFDRPAARPP